MAPGGIPNDGSEIDAAWLQEAIGTTSRIESLVVEPGSDAVGLMGEIHRCRIEWSDGDASLPRSVIVKLPSALPDNRALGVALGTYSTEHHFYSELAADVGVRTPRCWFTASNPDADRHSLVLEDIGHLQRVDQLDGLDADRARQVVDRLAAMHVKWWLSPRLDGLAWMQSGYGEAIAVFGDLVSLSIDAFCGALEGVVAAADLDVARAFASGYSRLTAVSDTRPWTLCHRDFRVDNMMFDGLDPVIFDWGATARAGGLYDVTYLLAGSLTTDVRRAVQDDLLDRYLRAIVDARLGYDPDKFDLDVKLGALFCLIIPVIAGGAVLNARDERGATLLREIIVRTFALLRDLHVDTLL